MNGGLYKLSGQKKKRNPKTGYSEYYMTKSEKPTDALSKAGRFGDDRMGIVDGELSHINPWEQYLLDTHGEIGEDIVKHIGSRNINPETGMNEYFFDEIGDAIGSGLGYIAGGVGDVLGGIGSAVGDALEGAGGFVMDTIEGGVDSLGNMYDHTIGVKGLFGGPDEWLDGGMWDATLGKEGVGGFLGQQWTWLTPSGHTEWFSHETNEERKEELERGAQVANVMKSSISDLGAQVGRSMGPQGSIAQQYGVERQLASREIGNQFDTYRAKQDQMQGQSGFATMGSANDPFDMASAILKAKESYMGEQKERDDLISSVQKELNTMMMEYTSATGKTYKSDDLNVLQEQLDNLRGA